MCSCKLLALPALLDRVTESIDPDRELAEQFRARRSQRVRRARSPSSEGRVADRSPLRQARRRRRRCHAAGVRSRVQRPRERFAAPRPCAAGSIGSRSTARCRWIARSPSRTADRDRRRFADRDAGRARAHRRAIKKARGCARRSRSCRRSRSSCSSCACSTICRSRKSPSSPTARENTAKVNFHYAVKKLRDILGGSR